MLVRSKVFYWKLLGFYLVWRLRGWYAFAALTGLIAFSLPRMAGGAHWLSDIVAGGLSLSLLFLPIFLFAPLREKCLNKLTKPCTWLYGKLPGFLKAKSEDRELG